MIDKFILKFFEALDKVSEYIDNLFSRKKKK